MGLPKSVQAQQDEVESYEAHLKNEKTKANEKPTELEEPPKAKVSAESSEPESSQNKPTQDVDKTGDPRHNDPEYWRNRFNVIQGKYNAEVPRLKSEIASKDRRIAEFEKQLESANSSLLTEEQKEEFGEYAEFVESTVKRSRAETDKKLADQEREIESLKADKTQSVDEQYYSFLAQEVPDWSVINESKAFNDWLEEVDEYSGLTYGQMLREADGSRNAKRVVFFFKKFGESGKQSASDDEDLKNNESLEDESHLPEKREGGSGDDLRDGLMTRAEIQEFYNDVNRGVYRGRQDEVDAMEMKIAQASKQGRII